MKSPVKTTKTLLEQINDALTGKIVYWVDQEKTHCSVIIAIDKRAFAICDYNQLPDNLKPNPMPQLNIKVVSLEDAMLGVYEVVSLN